MGKPEFCSTVSPENVSESFAAYSLVVRGFKKCLNNFGNL